MSEIPQWAREATEPSDIEVARLQAAVRAGDRAAPSRAPLWAAVGAATALLIVGFLLLAPTGYGPAPTPGSPLTLSEQPVELGPSIALTGDGEATALEAGEAGTVIALRTGTVTAEVDPEGAFRAFTVQAPGDVAVSVVGTRFTVSWVDDQGSVAVERGRVAVSEPAGSHTLGAGESWSWNGGVAAGEESLVRPVPGAADGAPELPSGGDRPPVSPREAPDAKARDPKAPELGMSPPEAASADPVVAPTPRLAPETPAEPEAVAVVEALTPSNPALVKKSDLAQASAFGRVLDAAEEERWADTVDLAERFLATYPVGSLAPAAGWHRIEALQHEDPKAAVAAAAMWLATYRSDTRRADVVYLHATLAYDRLEDCATAAPSYEEATAITSGERQAKSFAFLGLCAKELGDAALARRSIDAAIAHSSLPRPLLPALKRARASLPQEVIR
ncbi:MAG: FecR domain-containing protein [Deltaproteobacteria bacterium]|nr:FecR domain-containing protein [Deltaproteobacteria bacterium]